MAKLRPSSSVPAACRPFQSGSAEGSKNGSPIVVNVEWMFDTGASIGALTSNTANQFDLTPTGATASGTTGGGGIIVKTGLTVVFDAENSCGINGAVKSATRIGVKPNNSGNDLVGMNQLANVGVRIEWDPSTRTGRLMI